jgi:ubiquinone/menaquinone biosynthesis C-methylase UbiE
MDRSEKFWDRISKNYDQQDDQYDQAYYEKINNFLEPSDTVLDFACGTGSFSILISDNVKEIHAIDISSKMLKIAQRKADEGAISNINFLHSTIFDERLKRESYEVILAFNILHLLEDTPKVMQRINFLLKPGGYFISDTPCLGEKKSFVGVVTVLISKLHILPYVNNFSIDELIGSIEVGNFQIIETEKLSQTPPTMLIVAKK